MHKDTLYILAKVALLTFLYVIIYYTFFAFISKPTEGDSLDYHIPIAKMISQGTFLNKSVVSRYGGMQYSPGSSEAILSLFLVLGVPLNLYNVLGLLVLFLVTTKLALGFEINKPFAILFGVTICLLHGVVRWVPTQVIDIWLAAYFAYLLLLLQNPKKSFWYFVKVGFAAGMLVGSKYTGPLFLLVIGFFYCKSIVKFVNIQRFIAFSIPFTLFGLFWYIRNYIFTHDPYYPQSIFFFKGAEWHMLDFAVWKIVFLYPSGFVRTLNAFISEYTVWSLSLVFAIVFLIFGSRYLIKSKYVTLAKLTLIGVCNFIIYFFLPSGPHDNLMVSGFRYTYPAFIPLILSIFIFAKEFKKEMLLSVITIVNVLMISELSYHPKILLVYMPLGICMFFIDFEKLHI